MSAGVLSRENLAATRDRVVRRSVDPAVLARLETRGLNMTRIRSAVTLQALRVARELMPSGVRQGDRWIASVVQLHNEAPTTFSIDLRTGYWRNHKTHKDGRDLIGLAMRLWNVPAAQAALCLAERLDIDPFR